MESEKKNQNTTTQAHRYRLETGCCQRWGEWVKWVKWIKRYKFRYKIKFWGCNRQLGDKLITLLHI